MTRQQHPESFAGRNVVGWFLPPPLGSSYRHIHVSQQLLCFVFLHQSAILHHISISYIWCILAMLETCSLLFVLLFVTPEMGFVQLPGLYFAI